MGQRTYSDIQEDGTILAWEVERLWTLSAGFAAKPVPLAAIGDFDLVTWFDGEHYLPTCRAVTEHAQKIVAADFSYPVILSANGHVMDGMHRIAKAYLLRQATINAVQFEVDPEPDERLSVRQSNVEDISD